MFRRKKFKSEQALIDEEASRWIVELGEKMPSEREAEFNIWRSADVRHEAAVQKMLATWSRLSRLQTLATRIKERPNADLLAPRHRRFGERSIMWVALTTATLAACIILALTSSDILRTGQTDLDDNGMLVTTGIHDYSRINLDDGSILEVNANSVVRVHYQDSVRMVALIRGEAHFEVRKDALRPFLVKVDGIVFKAVGTAFNIRKDSDAVQLLVTEGSVEVNRLSSSQAEREMIELGEVVEGKQHLPEVLAGQQVTFEKRMDLSGLAVQELNQAAIAMALAWKGPRLFFDGTPIAEAVRQFNEHSVVQVTVVDPEIGNLRIGGSFLMSDIDAFLRLLEINNRIAVDRIAPDQAVIRSENPL